MRANTRRCMHVHVSIRVSVPRAPRDWRGRPGILVMAGRRAITRVRSIGDRSAIYRAPRESGWTDGCPVFLSEVSRKQLQVARSSATASEGSCVHMSYACLHVEVHV